MYHRRQRAQGKEELQKSQQPGRAHHNPPPLPARGQTKFSCDRAGWKKNFNTVLQSNMILNGGVQCGLLPSALQHAQSLPHEGLVASCRMPHSKRHRLSTRYGIAFIKTGSFADFLSDFRLPTQHDTTPAQEEMKSCSMR